MPRAITFYMDGISEHQRDLSNSASARFIPELFVGLLVATERLTKVSSNLVVDRKNMKKNFDSSRDSIVAEPLYIFLAKYGHSDAHEIVRELTLKSAELSMPLMDVARASKTLEPFISQFSKKEISLLESPESYVGLSVKKTEEVCAYWKKRFK